MGIAVSDLLQTVATGREILQVSSLKDAARQVAAYADREGVGKIVVGNIQFPRRVFGSSDMMESLRSDQFEIAAQFPVGHCAGKRPPKACCGA